jgi:uncharacterized membrane protein YedE/YeeE
MWAALFGGVLIGLGATLLWFGTGRIAGVSGIAAAALAPSEPRRGERIAFLAGLVLAGFFAAHVVGMSSASAAAPLGVVAAAGLLVGFGARVGSGCTSGHGVCGVSRFSVRSVVATTTFIVTGALTVGIVSRLFPSLGVPH